MIDMDMDADVHIQYLTKVWFVLISMLKMNVSYLEDFLSPQTVWH